MVNPAAAPRSPYDQVGGMVYLPRMLDKIRRQADGRLHVDYFFNLNNGFDSRCCRHLGVDYEALKARVLAGDDDAAIWAWCQANGRALGEDDVLIWNAFATKRGWRDGEEIAARLASQKAQSGLGDRDDLQTFFDYFEVDEGRKP